MFASPPNGGYVVPGVRDKLRERRVVNGQSWLHGDYYGAFAEIDIDTGDIAAFQKDFLQGTSTEITDEPVHFDVDCVFTGCFFYAVGSLNRFYSFTSMVVVVFSMFRIAMERKEKCYKRNCNN
jgi:hypothetical protein